MDAQNFAVAVIEKRPFSWWTKQDAQLRINGQLPADILIDYLDKLSIKAGDHQREMDRLADFLIVNSFFSILFFWADRSIDDEIERDGFLFFMRLKILALVETGRFDDLDLLIATKSYGEHRKRWIHATVCRLYSGQSSALFHDGESYKMPYQGHGSDLDFVILSLPSDIYRRKKLGGLLDYNSASYSFFDGFKPTEMPLDSPILNLDPELTAHPELIKGNFGCAYSTYMLYKSLFDSRKDDYYLIVEDDIVTLGPLRLAGDSGLERALDEFELIYLNDRLRCSGNQVEPVQEALQWMDASEGIKKNAPGNDGYIIKRSALEKMLNYFEERKISDFGSDWMLLMNSLTREDLENFKPGSIYRRMADRYRPFSTSRSRISACVLPCPLVKHSPRSTWNSWR